MAASCLYFILFLECPRYLADTDEKLKKTAELWHRIGWRDRIVSISEISCSGCTSDKQCTYHLVECTKKHGVAKCNQCQQFPCSKIKDMLQRSAQYEKKCRKVCTPEEYQMLRTAFFNKEENLMK